MQTGCTTYREEMERLIDGSIDEGTRIRLLQHAEGCPGCREELQWVTAASEDFESLGDAFLRNIEDVDVVDAVMVKISQGASPKTSSVGEAQRVEIRSKRVVLPLRLATWAAMAAALVAVAWFLAGLRPEEVDEPLPTERASLPREEIPPQDKEEEALEFAATPETGQAKTAMRRRVALSRPERVGTPVSDVGDEESPTRRAILDAFRDSMADESGMKRLVRWATLNRDQAEGLLAGNDTSPEALAGAAQGLPDEKAIPALLRALQQSPDDPYLRYRLARAFASDPLKRQEASEHITALQGLDADNAMGHYLEAQHHLEADPPNLAGALAAFEKAQALGSADGFALESAMYRQQALVEGGADPAVAQLLSALTAGRWEYDELLRFANELMGMGDDFQALGDTQTAVAVYEAVMGMGRQLATSAAHSQERMAGLDIERGAIEALSPMYSLLGNTELLGQLASATSQLIESILELSNFIDQLNALFVMDLDPETLFAIAGTILLDGDLNLFELIEGFLN